MSRNSDNETGDQNIERGLVDLSATTWTTTTTTTAIAATTSRYRTQASNEAKADDLLASHSLSGDLQETKQVLRDQLQERRQLEQTSVGRKKLLEQSGETEVRSCIQRRTTRSGRQLLERPRSSPSRIDSRTRIRLNHNDLKRIRYDLAKEAEKAANAAATSSSLSISNASKPHGGGSDYVKMIYVLPPPPPSRSTSRIRSAHPIKSKVKIFIF